MAAETDGYVLGYAQVQEKTFSAINQFTYLLCPIRKRLEATWRHLES